MLILWMNKPEIILWNIWMKTLKEFPEDVQRIIICHEKAEIESRIHLAQPPKEWEEAWIVIFKIILN